MGHLVVAVGKPLRRGNQRLEAALVALVANGERVAALVAVVRATLKVAVVDPAALVAVVALRHQGSPTLLGWQQAQDTVH